MSFLDKLKPKVPVMNVCMMGPKAVGKTTVLTAVFNETQNSIIDTSLNLLAKGDTNAELMDRLHMLHAIFAKKVEFADKSEEIANAGITASSFVSRFDFSMGSIGKDPLIDITIKDFPGEMVVNNQDEVINFIKESKCVFIAIDTPHLMELDGKYNDVKNKPKQITNLFKNAINEINEEKLILFIPLKCEKYFHQNRMEEVLEKVEKTYSELISQFEKTNKICCCVSPIMTLGNVDFKEFTYEGGDVKLAPDNCPAEVKYKYTNDEKYSPFFCSQPLYSLLLFVAAQYKRDSDRMNILDLLLNMLWRTFNDNSQLFEEILKLNRNRISDNPKLGYKTICGGYLFFKK